MKNKFLLPHELDHLGDGVLDHGDLHDPHDLYDLDDPMMFFFHILNKYAFNS